MSRILPDPQIVQLRAMRSGDIAIALAGGPAIAVGVTPMAFAQPIAGSSVTVSPAAPSTQALDGTPSETPGVGSSFATVTSQDATKLVDQSGAGSFPEISNTLVTLDGTPSLTAGPITVGKSTSVV